GGVPQRSTLEKVRTAFTDAQALQPPSFQMDIERLRVERRWSLRRLCSEAGLNPGALGRYRRQGTVPAPDDIARLADVLKVPKELRAAWLTQSAVTEHHRRRATPLVQPRFCPMCRESFVPSDPAQLFCSTKCRGDYLATYAAKGGLQGVF